MVRGTALCSVTGRQREPKCLSVFRYETYREAGRQERCFHLSPAWLPGQSLLCTAAMVRSGKVPVAGVVKSILHMMTTELLEG